MPQPLPPAKVKSKSKSKDAVSSTKPPAFKSFRLAFADLVEKRRTEGRLDPTLIYTNTIKRADEIVEWINGELSQAKKNGVLVAGAYHGGNSLTDEDRRSAHRAFMRDDQEVMVATMAYGRAWWEHNISIVTLLLCCAFVFGSFFWQTKHNQ